MREGTSLSTFLTAVSQDTVVLLTRHPACSIIGFIIYFTCMTLLDQNLADCFSLSDGY